VLKLKAGINPAWQAPLIIDQESVDMIRTFVLLVGGLASLWAVSAQAQEAVLGQIYGKGVQEYFSSDYAKAFERLTTAVDAGSRDPRVFYYRGLAYLKLGRTPEAEMDFRKGAELESKDYNKYYNVGRALERIQGPERQLLESYRVQARMAAYAEGEKIRKARYEALKREESRVLQQQVAEGAAAQAAESTETIPPPQPEATETKPADETNSNPAGVAPEEKKSAEKAGAGMGGASGAESATEDPFAPKGAEAEKPAVEKKPAAGEKPTTESKPAGKSILGALGKALKKGATGGDNAAATAEKPQPDAEKPPAEKEAPAEKPAETPADKPAETKAAEPADPFAN
jgi:tetratricopeptide (TPR) repeat protein